MNDVPPTEQEKQSQSENNEPIGQPYIVRAERGKKEKNELHLTRATS
jgi:hypothetical protein